LRVQLDPTFGGTPSGVATGLGIHDFALARSFVFVVADINRILMSSDHFPYDRTLREIFQRIPSP
jgi:hypothetical protein